MNDQTASVHDLLAPVSTPGDGIVSRTIHHDDDVRVVHFTFDPGQRLTEHTASVPAIIEIVAGEGTVSLADREHEAAPGTWIHLPANVPHAIVARTRLTMLLTMLRAS